MTVHPLFRFSGCFLHFFSGEGYFRYPSPKEAKTKISFPILYWESADRHGKSSALLMLISILRMGGVFNVGAPF